ncbi:MAG TPA: tetratricopeptide repeat protein [Vicinamibacterales bacterium]|nr:tetratricopeptide repeat protein [Vicinamibacterales bacterium]
MNPRRFTCASACAALVGAAQPAYANGASEALRAKASAHIYNLEHAEAMAAFKEAVAADPQDAAAYRGLATTYWLSITFTRGNMTVDDYLGRVTKPNPTLTPPPPQTVAAFRDAIDKAIAIAKQRLAANPKDADAHYQLGAAVGLRASYTATVDGSVTSAFRAAREAYDEHEEVLSLDPHRKDAGLIVGTYRYIVATLALPLRMMAYMAGFGGNREKGLRLIEEAAAYSGENQIDARFALILLYNREKRYGDALAQLALLRERYPGNRLVWLESGSTSLRAGRYPEAERFLDEGLVRFAGDQRTRMFGEDALWYYKRGTARAWNGRPKDAEPDLRKALSVPGRKWVHGRAHLELGRIAVNAGNKAAARPDLQQAVALSESDNDPGTAEEARRLMK